jgi:hypothetical protein
MFVISFYLFVLMFVEELLLLILKFLIKKSLSLFSPLNVFKVEIYLKKTLKNKHFE